MADKLTQLIVTFWKAFFGLNYINEVEVQIMETATFV